MPNIIKSLLTFLCLIMSTNSYAHIGYHNEMFHSHSSAEHFMITLAISLLSLIAIYLFRKK